jgi:hypothetical protein
VVVVVVELVQVLLVQLHYQHQHQVNLEEHLVKIVDHEVMLQMHRYFVVFLPLSINEKNSSSKQKKETIIYV